MNESVITAFIKLIIGVASLLLLVVKITNLNFGGTVVLAIAFLAFFVFPVYEE